MYSLVTLLRTILSGAVPTFARENDNSTGPAERLLARALNHQEGGEFENAADLCRELLSQSDLQDETRRAAEEVQFSACLNAAKARFPGPDYLSWLKWFHDQIKPATYLEIGVESGQSLKYAKAPTRAVGVDPAINVVHSQEAWVKLFRLPSDDFFAGYDLRRVLEAESLDLAFIDGLHTYDQALKDFMNIERYSRRNTIVLFHDIHPVIPETAQRERQTRFWVGDTWKVMKILKTFRPDLNIFTIPAFPSGLGVVTNLDSSSSLLISRFEEICRQADEFDLTEWMENDCGLVENEPRSIAGRLNLSPSE